MRSDNCRADRFGWLVCSALILAFGATDSVQARDRALLVGLEHYSDPRVNPTPGGREDARSMAGILEQQLGFARDDIRLLLDDAATSTAILDSFQHWLIEGSGPGDRVFFLYAGHGSQLKDQNGDEEDGLDETLAPFDVDSITGDGQIRDDVLDGLIAQLTGRRAVLLFDSCHSGTLTRGARRRQGHGGNSGVRYLPRPEEWSKRSALHRGTGVDAASYDVAALHGGDARAFDAPERLGRMAGIVAISAAGPGQLAFPVEVDGQPRGALSYLFGEAVSLGHRGLLDTLKDRVANSATTALGNLASGALENRLDDSRPSGQRPTRQRPVRQRPSRQRPIRQRPAESHHEWAASAQQHPEVQRPVVQSLTISRLELTIESGMKQLQSTGLLPGQQRPWFEVISETPIVEQPLFGGWQQAASLAIANPLDARRVSLRTLDDRTVYHRGESISFQVFTDHPGFLYLLVFSEEEKATCLFPNAADSDNWIGEGETNVPSHDGYRLPVQPPLGRDLVVALVSDRTLPLCETVDSTWDEIFARVQLRAIHKRLQSRAKRGIGVAATGTSKSSPAIGEPELPSWQTGELMIHTLSGTEGQP